MKLFSATVVASNSCYLKTFIIAEVDMDKAEKLLIAEIKREPNYKKKIHEIPTQPSIIKKFECEPFIQRVWFGENTDNNRESFDD